jgi:hypothetical protein
MPPIIPILPITPIPRASALTAALPDPIVKPQPSEDG